jgi:predicted small secreted protein
MAALAVLEEAMIHSIRVLVLFGAICALGACNTMQGLGRDLEAGGRAMARTAAEAQADLQAPNPATAPPAAALTAMEARARALSARPGAIEREEVRTDQRGRHYIFHIRGEDGGLYALEVDAQTGAAAETAL